jgi:hypothetical protein
MSLTTPLSQDQAAHRARVAGVLMLSSAVLSVLMMAHHPSVHSRDTHEVVSLIASQAAAAQWVHGVLIFLLGTTLLAYFEVTRRLQRAGLQSEAALLSYGVGVTLMIGAALISGFLIPRLASRYANGERLEIFAELLNFAASSNQVLAYAGVWAMSLGALLWSLLILRGGNRLVGLYGIGASLVPVIVLALNVVTLNVTGMMIVVLIQASWNAMIGIQLFRNRL